MSATFQTYRVLREQDHLGDVMVSAEAEIVNVMATLLKDKGLPANETYRIDKATARILIEKPAPKPPPPPPPELDPIIMAPRILPLGSKSWAVVAEGYDTEVYSSSWPAYHILVNRMFTTDVRTKAWLHGQPLEERVLQYLLQYPTHYQVSPCRTVIYHIQNKQIFLLTSWRKSTEAKIRTMLQRRRTDMKDPKVVSGLIVGLRQYLQSATENRRNAFSQELSGQLRNIETYRQSYLQALRRRDELEVLLEKLKSTKNDTDEQAGQYIRRISELPGIVNVAVEHETIIAETEEIIIEYALIEGPVKTPQKFLLGRYEIHLNLGNGDLRIYNLDRAVDGYHHPHVSPTGSPCRGEMEGVFPELIAARALPEAFTIILKFLRTVDQKDQWGSRLWKWPVYVPPPPPEPEKKVDEVAKKDEKLPDGKAKPSQNDTPDPALDAFLDSLAEDD